MVMTEQTIYNEDWKIGIKKGIAFALKLIRIIVKWVKMCYLVLHKPFFEKVRAMCSVHIKQEEW